MMARKPREPKAPKPPKEPSEFQIGFAQHQMKRGERFRAMVQAPLGYMLLEFDAAGQEFKIMAVQSMDETMLKLCLPDEDPHSYMGSRISHCDYRELIKRVAAKEPEAKSIRSSGKVGNLSLQYRTSPPRFRTTARVDYGIPMELEEAKHIWKVYRLTYPGVPMYWQRQIQKVQRLGYAETLAGRRVQVVGDWKGKLGWSMESTSINFPVQGTGADQKYLAIAVLNDYIIKHDIIFAWDLHDGLYFYCPREKAEKALVDMKRILDNLPYKKAWGYEPPIPLNFDAKWGTTWGNLQEYKG